MRREHADGPLGDFGVLLDEDRAALGELLHDVLVVHDLLAHVHGLAVQSQRLFDRLHGAVHAGAVAARRREDQLLDLVRHGRHCIGTGRRPLRAGGAPGDRYAKPMAQRHLDRLTPVDASFLHQEGPSSHMHIGGLTLVEGPPPSMDEFLEQIRRRLHLVPRYRHKLAYTALDSGRPVWVDDPSFNLEYHVRHTALPAPGTFAQLQELTARIFSQQLDRSKPLWEMWLIEGLEDDRFALITKTHHSLIDGIAGVDLATVLFDISPDPPQIPNSGRAWQPHPEPGTAQLVAAGLRGRRARRGRAGRGRARRDDAPGSRDGARPRGRRGHRRDRLGGPESGARDAAERPDRAAPPVRRRDGEPGRLQDRQERVRRHGQRRRAGGRRRARSATS